MAPPKAAPEVFLEQPEGYHEFVESLIAFCAERGYGLIIFQMSTNMKVGSGC